MRTSTVLLGVVLLGGVSACSHGSPKVVVIHAPPVSASPSTSPSPSASATPSVTAKATSPSSTLTGAPLGTVLTGAGSALTKPGATTTKTLGKQLNCFGLLDPGFNEQYCSAFSSKNGSSYAVVETQRDSERDLVYTATPGNKVTLTLRGTRTLPPNPNSNSGGGSYRPGTDSISLSDLNNDNTPKAIFLTPTSATAQSPTPLQTLDVVEANGHVVIHRELRGGTARKAFGGGLETWTPAGSNRAEHAVIQYQRQAWRLTSAGDVSSDSIPASTGQF